MLTARGEEEVVETGPEHIRIQGLVPIDYRNELDPSPPSTFSTLYGGTSIFLGAALCPDLPWLWQQTGLRRDKGFH